MSPLLLPVFFWLGYGIGQRTTFWRHPYPFLCLVLMYLIGLMNGWHHHE